MPGGRLTHDDRRRIADWLAGGLGYAEIARRLSRPTSTISREVARNLGPKGYLADRAQQITGRRARRRPSPQPEPAAGGEADEQVRGYVEEFAGLLARAGMPRMPARVFAGLLVADAGGRTAAELVQQLRVSPASVSKAIGYLETMDLVARRPGPGGSRRERYLVDDEVWLRAWRTDTGVHEQVAAAASRGVELFGPSTPAGRRLGQLGEFFGWLGGQMRGSALGNEAAEDALTAMAALAYARRPLGIPDLAAALGWSEQRAGEAMAALERHPDLAGRLTDKQRRALSA
ncbi:GbsR/MarR family transcriptional regulator [Flindersiella endophytica]